MYLLNTRMQWDIPLIHNLDLEILKYISNIVGIHFINSVASIYAFKPIKFLPFVVIFCWISYKSSDSETRKKVINAVIYGFISLVFCRILSYAAPFRARPKNTPDVNPQITNIPSDGWSSFPSDHGVFAFAMTYAIYKISPIFGLLIGLHSALIICFPRALLGLHYPSDLVFGGLLGLLIAGILDKSTFLKDCSSHIYTLSLEQPIKFYILSGVILFELVEMFETPRKIIFIIYDLLKAIN